MKVVRLNENDIEKLVKKIIRENDGQMKAQPAEPKKEEDVIKQTNNGALSAMDELIKNISDAKNDYTKLCNSKITGSNGYLDAIDGLATKFTALITSLEKSKQKVADIVAKKTEQDHMSYMKQKQRQRHIDHMKASKEGRYYA